MCSAAPTPTQAGPRLPFASALAGWLVGLTLWGGPRPPAPPVEAKPEINPFPQPQMCGCQQSRRRSSRRPTNCGAARWLALAVFPLMDCHAVATVNKCSNAVEEDRLQVHTGIAHFGGNLAFALLANSSIIWIVLSSVHSKPYLDDFRESRRETEIAVRHKINPKLLASQRAVATNVYWLFTRGHCTVIRFAPRRGCGQSAGGRIISLIRMPHGLSPTFCYRN